MTSPTRWSEANNNANASANAAAAAAAGGGGNLEHDIDVSAVFSDYFTPDRRVPGAGDDEEANEEEQRRGILHSIM